MTYYRLQYVYIRPSQINSLFLVIFFVKIYPPSSKKKYKLVLIFFLPEEGKTYPPSDEKQKIN